MRQREESDGGRCELDATAADAKEAEERDAEGRDHAIGSMGGD